jgi:hypothetical protein
VGHTSTAITFRNRGQFKIVPWIIWRHGNVEGCGFAQLSTSNDSRAPARSAHKGPLPQANSFWRWLPHPHSVGLAAFTKGKSFSPFPRAPNPRSRSPRPSSSNLAIGGEGEGARSPPFWLNLMVVTSLPPWTRKPVSTTENIGDFAFWTRKPLVFIERKWCPTFKMWHFPKKLRGNFIKLAVREPYGLTPSR